MYVPYARLPSHRSEAEWKTWLHGLAMGFARVRIEHDAAIAVLRRKGDFERRPFEDFRTHASEWLGDSIYDCDFDWMAFAYLVEDQIANMSEIEELAA